MKVLILSCNTGGGHNTAAGAIKEYLDSQNIPCEIRDALAFESQFKSDFISRGHVFVYKHAPRLFGLGYSYFDTHPAKPGNQSVIYEVVKRGAENLYTFLMEHRFDSIVSTHVFASMILTEIRKKHGLSFRSYFVSTDYTCCPGVEELDVDGYFVPHELLIPEFLNSGIPQEKLIPSGIPIKRSFYENISPEIAKERLDIPTDKRVVLMMCGSMGCGPIKDLTLSLAQNMPADAMLVVVCGSNEKLYEKLSKIPELPNVRVLGFTNQISLYMDAASVILTKPGGLSSTEAATKGLPMVFIDAVPGCESKNLDFFLQNDFAVMADSVEDLTKAVNRFLFDAENAFERRMTLRSAFSAYAAEIIGTHILSEATNHND